MNFLSYIDRAFTLELFSVTAKKRLSSTKVLLFRVKTVVVVEFPLVVCLTHKT